MEKLILSNKNLTIKSTELVEIINGFRKMESEKIDSKYKELQHYDFFKKIRKEVETLKSLGLGGVGNFSESTYVNSQNKIQPCFELNRDGMLQMLNSESTLVRYKTIEYINEMEKIIKENVPQLSKEESLVLEFYRQGGTKFVDKAVEYGGLIAERAVKEAIDGEDKVISMGQVIKKLDIDGLTTTTQLNHYFCDIGYGNMMIFDKLDRKGNYILGTNARFQPNQKFIDNIVKEGNALTGKTINEISQRLTYTVSMVNVIKELHTEGIKQYIKDIDNKIKTQPMRLRVKVGGETVIA